MPRYHFHAARREVTEQEPIVLTLSGDRADGTPLPEFEEEFPSVMQAAVQTLMLEAAIVVAEADDEFADPEERASDEEKAKLGIAALTQTVGKERMRKWSRAGYTLEHLMQVMQVLVYYWREGRFPNAAPAPSNGTTPNGAKALPAAKRMRRPSVKRSSTGRRS